jgi:phage regulator Rha-like protein
MDSKQPSASRWRNVLLVISSILVSFVFMELYLRIFMPQDLIVPMPAVQDTELIYRLKADTKAYLKGTSVRWFHLETNSLGLRDREIEPGKMTDRRRVMLLGDSMSMAEGVELEETYIKRFEEMTNRTAPGRRVEAINAAIRGYGNDQEVLLFERLGPVFLPDVVVLAFFEGNDLEDNRNGGLFRLGPEGLVKRIPTESDSPKLRYYNRQIQIQNIPGYRFLVGNFHLVNFARMHYARYLMSRHDEVASVNSLQQAFREEDLALTRAILKRWQEDCRRLGAVPVILYMPAPESFGDPRASARTTGLNSAMSDFAREQRIAFLDLTAAFRKMPDPQLLYLKDGHLSPEGHVNAAGALHEFLKQRSYL